jgi:DNA-binding transcriptional regulator GbsR (MarR family)
MTKATHDPVALARRTLLEGVGAEVAASFPGITRLGGQIVAALYLADGPTSMDALSAELGCSKSNVFTNLRALEAAGIVERHRRPASEPQLKGGRRHDLYVLRGKYPDIVVGAYLARLRAVIDDKRALTRRALAMLSGVRGKDADSLRTQLDTLARKYDRFGDVMDALLPVVGAPIDIEAILEKIPPRVLKTFGTVVRKLLR